MKVCFETFGCRLNRAEALQMEAEYAAGGWERTEKHSEADLFVVRGCSVTRRAQHDCEKLIEHLRKHYPNIPLRICGCLEEDAMSTAQWKRNVPITSRSKAILPKAPDDTSAPPLPTRTARAYLKCQDGCSGKCAFCIVPKFRGSSVSVPFGELTDKAKQFIDAGYHEIVLTGCNLSLYASEAKRLPELVAALAALSPDCRFRLGSLEPGDCAQATVDVMADNENVCRFLHIPVQSGSNAILTGMKRPYLVRDIEALVDHATARMPLVGLGCDMMTGFPGETETDFMATKGLFKRLAFSNAHIFPFSERPGTLAAALTNVVPREIRHRRGKELASIARIYRAKAAKKFIGRDVDVVIEDEKLLTGWSGEYFPCEIVNRSRATVKRKELVHVHVIDVAHDRLKALII